MASELTVPGHVVARVRVPERGIRRDLRAIKVVWQRELIRFSRDRLRVLTALLQPALYIFVLGSGLQRLTGGGTHGVNLRTFVYPGALAMAVMFTAVFSAASIVWDREFGFLREMLVAPVRRGSIVLGKCLGGATVAAFQGLLVIAFAGLAGVPYNAVMIFTVIGLLLLFAFAITAFGVMLAARIAQMQTFMGLVQMLIMPMFFIAGALFPVSHLPRWLEILNRVDPLTYAVDPIRHTIFSHLNISAAARHTLDPGVTWWSWRLPGGVEALIVALLGLAMLFVAILEFKRAD
jgi:ABC-2 type transport system permease protein